MEPMLRCYFVNGLFALIIVMQLCCTAGTGAQAVSESLPIGNGMAKASVDEAFIAITPRKESEIAGRSEVLETAAPSITFIYNCQREDFEKESCRDNPSTLLPTELEHDLEKYWHDCLKFRYRMANERFPDAKSESDAARSFTHLSLEFVNKLTMTKIEAPNGLREISRAEAGKVIRGLNLQADKAVKEFASR